MNPASVPPLSATPALNSYGCSMTQKSSPSPPLTVITSTNSTPAATPEPSTPSGDSTPTSSTEPTSSISTRPLIDWNGFVDPRLEEWEATHLSCHRSTSEPSFSPNWTALAMKLWLPILISLSLWAILLFGLYAAIQAYLSFAAPPHLQPILYLGLKSCPPIIRLRCYANGNFDPRL